MNPRKRATRLALASAALFAAGTQAQQPAPAPAQLAPVIVRSTPLGSDTFQFTSPVDLLEGQGLRLKSRPTLGDTLGEETGVSQTWFGPNSSRPIIRGLDGDRIRVLQNGIGVVDASTVSFDHAVSVEPLIAERIEVVRGPAALFYGGNAVGGVVNVIDSRIAQEPLARSGMPAGEARFGGPAGENAGAVRFDGGTRDFVLHVDGFKRNTGDLRIPGNAWTAAAQAERGGDGPSGRLTNSSSSTDGAAIGGSLLLGDKGYTGASYSGYNSEYGTVAEENVRIDLRQRRFEFAGELRDLAPALKGLKYRFGHSDYQHQEIESGSVGTTFKNRGYDGRVELAHGRLGPFDGAFGVQFGEQKFEALGAEAFLPRTKTDELAGFFYEEWRSGRWKLSFGGRVERVEVRADEFVNEGDGTQIAPAGERRFTPWSAAAGVFYALAPQYGIAFNAAYTQRAPVSVELYANGPHVATNAFEIGDTNLGTEKSTAFDLALRKQGADWSGAVGIFYNRFSDFVTLLSSLDPATGQPLFRDGEDRALPAVTSADAQAAGYAEPLRQLVYTAVPAEFKGFEANARVRVAEWGGNRVEIEARGDYTRAERRDTDAALPRIPPLRYGAGVIYTRDRLGARLDLLHAARQNRVPEGETTTASYTMLNASIAYRMRLGSADLEAFLRGTNLLDEEARLATSFLRDIAPLGRRAVMVGVRAAL